MWINSNGEDTPNWSTYILYSGIIEVSQEAMRKHFSGLGIFSPQSISLDKMWFMQSPPNSSVCQTVPSAFSSLQELMRQISLFIPGPRTSLSGWKSNQQYRKFCLTLLHCWATTFLGYTVFRWFNFYILSKPLASISKFKFPEASSMPKYMSNSAVFQRVNDKNSLSLPLRFQLPASESGRYLANLFV